MRVLHTLLALLIGAGTARAEAVNLTEAPLAGSCLRNELSLELKGKLKVQQEGKPREYPHEAKATHVFVERILDATAGREKVVRSYLSAEATIVFNNEPATRTLRPERRFLVVHRVKDQLVPFSHKGPLTRTEVELTEHFDTLAVSGLVPGKEVAVGDSWKIGNATAACLCDLEGLVEHNLVCKLEEVKDGLARVSISGSASGVGQGAAVNLMVSGGYDFDVEAKRIVRLEWKQSDQREQGPISPALSADVVIRLTRKTIPEPEELSDTALAPVKEYEAPPARLSNIVYKSPRGRFELEHSRDWHVVSPDASEQLVLRLMERGQFVAQATVTPWKKVEPKSAPTLEEFAAAMAKTPGWAEDKVTEQAELKDDAPADGQRIYRVTASGSFDNISAVASFYLLISKDGELVMITFTMKPDYVSLLRERDLDLVKSVVFPQ